MKAFTFSKGGPHIEIGQIACVAGSDIMHNEIRYPSPGTFDGLRFVRNPSLLSDEIQSRGSEEMRGTTFTDGSKDFPIWGFGSKIWYVGKIPQRIDIKQS